MPISGSFDSSRGNNSCDLWSCGTIYWKKEITASNSGGKKDSNPETYSYRPVKSTDFSLKAAHKIEMQYI